MKKLVKKLVTVIAIGAVSVMMTHTPAHADLSQAYEERMRQLFGDMNSAKKLEYPMVHIYLDGVDGTDGKEEQEAQQDDDDTTNQHISDEGTDSSRSYP